MELWQYKMRRMQTAWLICFWNVKILVLSLQLKPNQVETHVVVFFIFSRKWPCVLLELHGLIHGKYFISHYSLNIFFFNSQYSVIFRAEKSCKVSFRVCVFCFCFKFTFFPSWRFPACLFNSILFELSELAYLILLDI